jgi:hypothetical protein
MNMHSAARRNRAWTIAAAACCLIAMLSTPRGAAAQSLTYTSGQPVWPAFEGWEQAADGARYFLFGYMNRNWEE